MPYNSIISRTDADALIPVDVASDIQVDLADSSWLMGLARKLPNMSRAQTRLPVMSALATAYFVTGDTSLKQTTEVNWDNTYIDAEEVAAIVAIPEAVLDDADYDIWGEVKPALVEAFNIAITNAVLYGTNIPATWTTNMSASAGLVAFATAAGSVASLATFTDFYEATEGETAAGAADGVIALLENDGYQANGHIGHVVARTLMRNCRATGGEKLYPDGYNIDGVDAVFPNDGTQDSTEAYLISGDWSKLVYSVRQDMTFKVLDQAVLQDAAGNITYNLAQQDMVALRAVMRIGFALPNTINRMNETEATRSPFAILTA